MWWAAVAIAQQQHGVVAHGQLTALGVSASSVHDWLRAGRLHPLHTGVYSLGRPGVPREGTWMAAVLACGPSALLSHRDAAALWGILPTTRPSTDVTTARRCRGRPRITLHRSRRIHADDRATREGVPVTSVARTLLDLAEVVPRRRLDRALENAERNRLFDLSALDGLIARSRGRRGLRPLKRVLAAYRPLPFTRSVLERRFVDLCRAAGLPPPSVNLFVAGDERDATWPEQRLVVELDGYEHHHTHAAFERDRRRDADLQRAGYRVLRISHRQLTDAPGQAIATVRALLDRPR